jgi:hypothetical protein
VQVNGGAAITAMSIRSVLAFINFATGRAERRRVFNRSRPAKCSMYINTDRDSQELLFIKNSSPG